jgi:hypothetical protein
MRRISAELIGSADTGDDRARNITRKNFPILMASLQGESQRAAYGGESRSYRHGGHIDCYVSAAGYIEVRPGRVEFIIRVALFFEPSLRLSGDPILGFGLALEPANVLSLAARMPCEHIPFIPQV